jgi:hypothetical protein
MSRLSRLIVLMVLAASPVLAQTKPAEKTPEQLRAEVAQLQAKIAEGRTLAEAQPVNIRLELTITDQRAETPVISKTVSMTVADRHSGRIRTQGDVRTPTGFRPVILNVDCQGTLLARDRARMILTIEYRPVAGEAENERATTPNVNESIAVILEDGKPMVISQSADPVTDRRVKVEAKITLLR